MTQGAGINWEDPEQATKAIEASLLGMPDDEVQRLNETQINLINVMTGRIEYAESRRGAFATIAAGFIAAGIALLSISLGDHFWRISLLLGLVGGGLALTGCAVLWLFGRQTNPNYGFIKPDTRLKRPWKWFYRDALSNSNAFRSYWFRKGTDAKNLAAASAFDHQWGEFAQRQITLGEIRVETLQNIKQVYLLHVNERYKNLFLTEIRKLLIRGLVGTVFVTSAVFLVSFAVSTDGSKPTIPGTPSATSVASPQPTLSNPSATTASPPQPTPSAPSATTATSPQPTP